MMSYGDTGSSTFQNIINFSLKKKKLIILKAIYVTVGNLRNTERNTREISHI